LIEQALEKPTGPAPAPAEEPQQQSLARAVAIFAGQRLLFGLFVLLAIIYLTYVAFALAQGANLPTALVESLGSTLTYIGNLLQGNLGLSQPRSAAFRAQPVMDIVPVALVRSLGLLGATFGLATIVGVPLGIIAAMRRHSRGALIILVVSFIGISTPVFFAALFLQIAAVEYTRTVGHSIVPVGGFGWDKHMILPVLVLASRPIAQITRVTFVTVSDILDQDYVRVARGKGLRAHQILLVHIMRNSAIPILTTMVITLRFVLSSLPVVETYFGWGGLGEVLLRAIFLSDLNLTIAFFLLLGIIFILVNITLEVSYYYIDPRIQPGASYRGRSRQDSLLTAVRSIPSSFRETLTDNPFSRWLEKRRSPDDEPSPFRALIEQQGLANEVAEMPGSARSRTWSSWRHGVFGNAPLLLGCLIVGILLYLMLFGPSLAPLSPNTTQLITVVDGVIETPPYAPDDTYRWGTDSLGRDLYSLILSGVQQTLFLAFGVVAARVSVGTLLGVLAGWFNDSWLDRIIMGVVQAVAVFPTLLLATLLIFAIGFQSGMFTFFLALSLVGWGEIVEFVRGEVISIRPKPFIESAVAAGQSTSRLIRVHFLPNLAPGLVAISAVEVAAVLLLLGELGFIGIFIQGGASTDFGLYSQVPEWGSLLSGVRQWVRSYPWTGFYPAAAFFIAILGFNLFGEGLRRLLGRFGQLASALTSRYALAAVALIVVGLLWARQSSGEIVFYRRQAETFDTTAALARIEALIDPALKGRSLDSAGLALAAEYIADEFSHLGLQPAGQRLTYFQEDTRSYHLLDSEPTLILSDGQASPEYFQEYSVYPKRTLNIGRAQGDVRLLAAGPEAQLESIDLSADIVLLLDDDDLGRLTAKSCQGVLIMAEDQGSLKQRYTLSAADAPPGCGSGTPVLWINDRLANRLLGDAGLTLSNVAQQVESLDDDGIIDVSTSVEATMDIPGSVKREVPVVNVIGHLPGTSNDLDSDLIIVAAQYDSPPAVGGDFYPGANDNASGVAVMLEVIRAMQESGYQPFKTFLFVAYSGEGLPDLSAAPDVESYLRAKPSFETAFDIEAVIYLRGLGAGGEALSVTALENTELAKLMETAAHLNHVETDRFVGNPSMNVFVPGFNAPADPTGYPQAGISRTGWYKTARLPNDNLTFITGQNVEDAGRSVALGLMILGRETNF
jgi:peptide/nickel transport system permease protein